MGGLSNAHDVGTSIVRQMCDPLASAFWFCDSKFESARTNRRRKAKLCLMLDSLRAANVLRNSSVYVRIELRPTEYVVIPFDVPAFAGVLIGNRCFVILIVTGHTGATSTNRTLSGSSEEI